LNISFDIVNLSLDIVDGVGLPCVKRDLFAVKGGPSPGPHICLAKLSSWNGSLLHDRIFVITLLHRWNLEDLNLVENPLLSHAQHANQ
jgi:hypothetical protein